MLALLIGSLASAEERQLGTLEWQGLLPMASWKQWAAKVGDGAGAVDAADGGAAGVLLLPRGVAPSASTSSTRA